MASRKMGRIYRFAILENNTFVPNSFNIINNEIDQLINSFTNDITTAVAQSVPMGRRGRMKLWDIPDSIDRWFSLMVD